MWELLTYISILLLGMMIGSILTLAGIFWMWYTGGIERLNNDPKIRDTKSF